MIRKITLLLLCCGFSVCDAEPAPQDSYDLAISLGNQCHVTDQLVSNDLRGPAFPFDWNLTSFESIFQFIANEGKNFLDKNKVAYVWGPRLIGPEWGYIEDTVYHIQFLHDFVIGANFMKNYSTVKSKYDRRVKRFFSALRSNKRLLFVRLGITREEAVRLDDLIHSKYPTLDYTILAVDFTEEMKADWEMERVQNYYIEPIKGPIWLGPADAWKAILSKFALKVQSSS